MPSAALRIPGTFALPPTTAPVDKVKPVSAASATIELRNHVESGDIERLLPAAEKAIGKLATPETVMRVARHNADALWLFGRAGGGRPQGFQAWLPFNERGRENLFDGSLDLHNPPNDCLAAQGETPVLLYIWATYTPGRTAAAIGLTMDRFSSPRYQHVDIVSWAAGVRGEMAMTRLGFTKGYSWRGHHKPHFWAILRSPESLAGTRPRYDSYVRGLMPTGITVVHDLSEFLKVAAIRAAVYVAEQDCPYEEEFDGNDFAATHLLAYQGDEPVGCMRVRFFGDFAKLERLAVRRSARRSNTAFELVRAAVDLCRAKGVRNLYGHARLELLPFWQRFGFKVKAGSEPFVFSDQTYVEMWDEGAACVDAVSAESGPYTTIRPEGRWHKPGPLDASVERGARGATA